MRLNRLLVAGAATLLLTVPLDAAARSSNSRSSRDSCSSRDRGRYDDSYRPATRCRHSDCRGARSCRYERHDRQDRYDCNDRYDRNDRRDRYDRNDRYDRCDRNDGHDHSACGTRGHSDARRGRDWGPLDVVHFVAHVLDGQRHRDYDCGCRATWRAGHFQRTHVHGTWRQVWVADSWDRSRSCDYHR